MMQLDAETRMRVLQTHASSRHSAIGLIAVMSSEALLTCLQHEEGAPERQLTVAIVELMQSPPDARFVLTKIGEAGVSLLPPHLAAAIVNAASMSVADEAPPHVRQPPLQRGAP
ncbi:hypothetical protein [Roseiflexus castenholzii]|uniref:hypothetical protein n=1 Tax=Roseiflexus castenholzii TaxID=120962 RepID=UPI003C7AD03E